MAKKSDDLRYRLERFFYRRRVAGEQRRARAGAARLERVYERRRRAEELQKKLSVADRMSGREVVRMEKRHMRRYRFEELQAKLGAWPRTRTLLPLLVVIVFATLTGLLFHFHPLSQTLTGKQPDSAESYRSLGRAHRGSRGAPAAGKPPA